MKSNNDITPVMVKCPECGTVQGAIVEHTFLWDALLHDCVNCKYLIMESEFNIVKPFVYKSI